MTSIKNDKPLTLSPASSSHKTATTSGSNPSESADVMDRTMDAMGDVKRNPQFGELVTPKLIRGSSLLSQQALHPVGERDATSTSCGHPTPSMRFIRHSAFRPILQPYICAKIFHSCHPLRTPCRVHSQNDHLLR